jgi:hypothetical protein
MEVSSATDMSNALAAHPSLHPGHGHGGDSSFAPASDTGSSGQSQIHPQLQSPAMASSQPHSQDLFVASSPAPGHQAAAFPPLAPPPPATHTNNNTGPSPLEMLSDAAAAPARHTDRDTRSSSAELSGEIGTGIHDPLRVIFSRRYETFPAAHAAAEETARQNGFALSIRSKRPTAENFNRAVLACSQGGKYRASHTAAPDKRRQTSTLKTGCPYKVAIKRSKLGLWHVEAVQGASRDKHNHGSLSTSAFSRYRHRLVESMKDDVIKMTRQGLKASTIRDVLIEGRPDYASITIHDVRNAMKRYERGDEQPTQQHEQQQQQQPQEWKAEPDELEGQAPGEHGAQELQEQHPGQHQMDGMDAMQAAVPPASHVSLAAHMVPQLSPHDHLQQMDQIGQMEHIDADESSLHAAAAAAAAAHYVPHQQQQHHMHHHPGHHHDGVAAPHDEMQQHYHHAPTGDDGGQGPHDIPLGIPIDPAVTQERAEEANM